MNRESMFPEEHALPFGIVHIGTVVGRTVRCRVPFGPLERYQADAVTVIRVSQPHGFSLQPFDDLFHDPVLLPDGSVLLGLRADDPMPAGEYLVKITVETFSKTADIIPETSLVNAVMVHVYPDAFYGVGCNEDEK